MSVPTKWKGPRPPDTYRAQRRTAMFGRKPKGNGKVKVIITKKGTNHA